MAKVLERKLWILCVCQYVRMSMDLLYIGDVFLSPESIVKINL